MPLRRSSGYSISSTRMLIGIPLCVWKSAQARYNATRSPQYIPYRTVICWHKHAPDLSEMIGDIRHHHIGVRVERQLQTERRLVVQRAFPPVGRNKLWQDHCNHSLGMGIAQSVYI